MEEQASPCMLRNGIRKMNLKIRRGYSILQAIKKISMMNG